MSFISPPDPIGSNISFTALSNGEPVLNLYELPEPSKSSIDITLTNSNSIIPYDLPNTPSVFAVKTIVFSPGTPIPTTQLLVNLATSASVLLSYLFKSPQVGDTYEVIMVNNTNESIDIELGSKNVILASQSVKKLTIIATNVNIGSEEVSLNATVVGGLGSVPINIADITVNAPPSPSIRIPAHQLITGTNVLGPTQVNFTTTATSIDQNGPLPTIKDMLNQIAGIQTGQKLTIQFISHNKGATLTWAPYTDDGGGPVAVSSTPSTGAPFEQLANTSYLISLTITPVGVAPNWANSTMKIGCLPLAV